MIYSILLGAGSLLASVWAASLLFAAGRAYEAICLACLGLGASWAASATARRATDRIGLLAAAFAAVFVVGVSGYLAAPIQPASLWPRLFTLAAAAGGALFVHLASAFPPARVWVRQAVPLAYAVAAVVAVPGRTGPAMAFFLAMQVLGTLIWWDTFHRARRAGDVQVVRRTQVLLMGPLIAWLPFIAFIPQLLPTGVEVFLYGPAIIFLVMLPFALAGALTHPDMFDTGTLLRRVLIGILLVSASLLVYFGLVHLLTFLLGQIRPDAGRDAAVFGAAITVAVMFRPLETWLARQIDRAFFPDRIGFRVMLNEASEALASTIVPASLHQFVTTALVERLGVSGAVLLALDDHERTLAPLAADEPVIATDHSLRRVAELATGPSYVTDPALTLGLPAPALLIPLRVGARLVGLCLLGARVSGLRYTREELGELRILGHHLAVAVENGRAYGRIDQLNQQALVEVEERNRLAREIHDTLAQGLASIGLQLDVVEATVATRPEKAEKAARRAHELVQANLAEARRSVLELRAPLLGSETLPEALQRALEEAAANIGARAAFRVDGVYTPLPARTEGQLYLIAQEALHNAVKHSGAGNLEVWLNLLPDRIHLCMTDDGTGFDPGAEHAGFGLRGMAERANLAGGQLSIESGHGAGTRITITVPREEGALHASHSGGR